MHDLVFIIYAALAMVLLLVSSFPHFRSRNVGAFTLVVWAFVGCLGNFVAAIVWWDNVGNHAPVWCDIWTKISIGLTTAIASSCLCINRRLKIISSARRTTVSGRERRFDLWIDLAISWVPCILVMALHYTVQGNRFNINEGFECVPATYTDWKALLLCYVPCLLIGCISFVYGGLSIYNFTSRRRQFQSILQQSGGGLDTSRFIRLVSLSSLEMLLSVPFSSGAIGYLVNNGLMLYLGWSDTHADFSKISIFTQEFSDANPLATNIISMQRWFPVFAAFANFCFFGMQEEALRVLDGDQSGEGNKVRKEIRTSRVSFLILLALEPSRNDNDEFLRLPQLGNTIGPVSPSNANFVNRSAEDFEKGGLSLTTTKDGEEDPSGLGYRQTGIAVRVERNVVEE